MPPHGPPVCHDGLTRRRPLQRLGCYVCMCVCLAMYAWRTCVDTCLYIYIYIHTHTWTCPIHIHVHVHKQSNHGWRGCEPKAVPAPGANTDFDSEAIAVELAWCRRNNRPDAVDALLASKPTRPNPDAMPDARRLLTPLALQSTIAQGHSTLWSLQSLQIDFGCYHDQRQRQHQHGHLHDKYPQGLPAAD